MKEINGYLLVGEIPEGQRYFDLYGNENQQEIVYNKMTAPGKFKTVYISLPKGNYSIIGLAKDLTEEQWRRIVENDANFGDSLTSIKFPYKNYQTFMLQCKTATESGHSLLKANNLNPNTTLILKQVV